MGTCSMQMTKNQVSEDHHYRGIDEKKMSAGMAAKKQPCEHYTIRPTVGECVHIQCKRPKNQVSEDHHYQGVDEKKCLLGWRPKSNHVNVLSTHYLLLLLPQKYNHPPHHTNNHMQTNVFYSPFIQITNQDNFKGKNKAT